MSESASYSADNFNLLAAKLKLQTEQRIKYQQELSTLANKFQEFKNLQESIQLMLAHNHQGEIDSWQQKYTTLHETYKLDKERNGVLNPTPQSKLEDDNLQLKESLNTLQHKLKTEKIRSQQNLELFVSTQAKLNILQDQVAGQQLHDVNLAHLISLQQQIDQIAIEKLKNPLSSAQQQSTSSTDKLIEQYPTPVLLLEEIQLLKSQHNKDQTELVQLRLQVQEMSDLQSQVNQNNGSITQTLQIKVNKFEQDLEHSNELIKSFTKHEKDYKNEINSLQNIIKEQNDNYENLLSKYNLTSKRLKQSHEDFALNLTQEMAQLTLNSSSPTGGGGNNDNNGTALSSEENADHIAELEHNNKQQLIKLERYENDLNNLKNKIKNLTIENEELFIEINSSKETINIINDKHNELEETLIELNQHKLTLTQTANVQIKTVLDAVNTARQERDTYRQDLVDKDALLIKLQIRYQTELQEQRQQQIGQYIGQLQQIQEQLSDFRNELMLIRDYIAGLGDQQTGNGSGTGGNDNNSNDTQTTNKGGGNILTIVKTYIKEQNDQLTFLKQRYDQEVKLRKSIFNQLQELKGNIRVYARLRPISQSEKSLQGDVQVIQCINQNELRVIQDLNGKKNIYPFDFEQVFDQNTTQEEVFNEVKDLIMSVIDGYNVCLFAYGQTGSGKTHTMTGNNNGVNGINKGINPRALELLFNYTTTSSDEWDWTIKLTMVEIYNEKIQDLLRTGTSNNDADINLKIVAGKDGKNEVQGCNQVIVNSAEEVAQYLSKGNKNRHVSATQMNAESSRSHLVVTVYTQGYNRLTKINTYGKLNIVDLAGSERVSRSGVTGDGLKEAQNINASLSTLGTVIAARANKQSHVPYRNSQLTYLLQDSLDKNSKTLMFVQLSPSIESVGETLCSLRFAARVKEVELGKATSSKTAAA